MNIQIYCLALDKRKDLWTKLSLQIKEHTGLMPYNFIVGDGTDPELTYNHIDIEYNNHPFLYGNQNNIKQHFNAFLGHKKIAQMAIDNKADKLFLIEDDSYLVESRFDYIFYSDEMKNFLKQDNWDVVYLGWWQTKTGGTSEDREDLEERWSVNKEFGIDPVERPPAMKHEICGLHGVIFNKHFIQCIAQAPQGPIDSILNHNFDHIKAYYVWPKIIHTHSTWSYCEHGYFPRSQIK